MCELLGISRGYRDAATELMQRFQRRGGDIADNPDGWGIAYLDSGTFALHKEPQSAARSRHYEELAGEIRTDLLIAHVRKANYPPVNTLANTHPFKRVCCGREWIFAHNGLVPEIVEIMHRDPHPRCTPAGDTDSEYAFCHLLENIALHFNAPHPSGTESWFTILATVSELVASHGKFNFLISDGTYLIAYGHNRLHYREHRERGTDNSMRHEAWVATEPLTDEPWQPFERGELRIYHRGQLTGRLHTQPPPAK
jgi:glutamine amidotransferase